MAKTNQAGIALIMSFEGCELHPYLDAVGVPTIGYGHTHGVAMDMPSITQEGADRYLANDLGIFERGVQNLVKVELTPNAFASLVSFAYNLGLESLAESTLLKLVNEKDFAGAAEQFSHWVYAGGEVLEGLVRRRQAEKELFLK